MKRICDLRGSAFACLCLVFVTVRPACAQLMAYDGFNYPTGTVLLGQTGGFGWRDQWHDNFNSGVVSAGSLYFAGLRTLANSVTMPSEVSGNNRNLENLLGADGTTAFFSLLVEPIDPVGSGQAGSYGGLVMGELFVGKLHNNYYGMQHLGGGGDVYTNVLAKQYQTVLLVVRARFASGNDTFDLYVNPIPGGPLPEHPDATKSDLDLGTLMTVGFGSDSSWAFDEIRVGRMFADVAPAELARTIPAIVPTPIHH